MSLGEDYDERVLPSITTEVLKAIVVSILYIIFRIYQIEYQIFSTSRITK
jgi:hypothetical protein